ncbi:hypothetical protein ENUP19_0252G0095 [Entamoeba nuttalli]|uniref:Uncharacterized protein n=2 Tax=Entamoeba nuttalli TaxID=412467 RepID=K2HCU9_ENTNP|nr:hypothetical protein ENU1_086250 [Entamoeba nuttalli P19]EKE40569.1 hypothetical protein ENU1_086250 [Entamoeba nuttalli P19]|eukprot:XP_008857095.1 hypothetical protein ENU1_086250 [Entamoeba nuttalli P19]
MEIKHLTPSPIGEDPSTQIFINNSSDNNVIIEKGLKNRNKAVCKKYLKQKNELKSFESIQQSILLALLNKYCEFTLELPTKLSTVTLNNPQLIKLTIGTEEINVKRLSESMYANSFIADIQKGIKEETCVRNYEKKKEYL